MIEYNKDCGLYIIVCDDCGDEYEAITNDFNDAVDEIKQAEGWTIEKSGDEYTNYCEICSKARKKELEIDLDKMFDNQEVLRNEFSRGDRRRHHK
jgi:hypothetical protein